MILAILQARMSSSRLPGKVLMPLLGKPMLARQIERVQRSRRIDQLVIATSTEPADDPIESLSKELSVSCFRGSLEDVLDRFYQAAVPLHPDYIVRLTADCPLADPEVVDAVIGYCIDKSYDYASNALEPTFPDGLDVEAFRFGCLREAWSEAKLPSEREHVTPFIYRRNRRYRIGSYKGNADLSLLRWTVDEPADFELVARIYAALYPRNPAFTTRDVLDYLDANPALKSLNAGLRRNERLDDSLNADADFLANRRAN